jgi:hypothetical protein
MKICSNCEEAFPATKEFFYKEARGINVLFSRCKKCVNLQQKERNQRFPERRKEIYSASKKKHHNVALFHANKRRALKLLACPVWSDLIEIKNIYENRPHDSAIDHIVPLQHPQVCGLHIPENLQYLTKEENLVKSNKFPYKYNFNRNLFTWLRKDI